MARSIDKGNRLPKNDGISINNGNLSCKSVMNSFYHCAFSQTPSERDDELKVFRVFIGRRSFVKAFLYIQEHQIDEKICETVYSDVGFRVLAAKLGAEFVKAFTEKQIDNFFNNRVFLYDDILIHGRALSGLLSAAEEIFISSFEQAAPKGLALPRDVLSAIFLSIVTIKTAVQNNQALLLPRRFKMTHDKGSSKKMNPCSWRRFSSEIAEEIYNSGIPNAAFMPGVLFDENSGFRQMLSERFRGLSEQGLLLDFGFSETAYRGRNMDSYISFQFEEDSLLAVFTIRCTDKYLIPFVFLPGISDKQFSLLTKHISDRIKLYSLDLGKLTEELFDEYRLQVSPYLNVFYSELVNMILGTALLRSFLNVLGIQIQDSEYNLSTTKALMMSNYAHKSVINELFRLMFDESLPPLFSLKELRRLLVDTTEKKSCIFSEISDITDKDSDDAAIRDKVLEHIERVAFQYGIESEKSAKELSLGSLPPSALSLQYFSFPTENTLTRTLKKIYRYKKSWIRNSASMSTVFSYLLQLMDYGCLSLTIGESDRQIKQCLKAGEQSMATQLQPFSLLLPLLYEMEDRCLRKNKSARYYFSEELMLFIRAGENRKALRNDIQFLVEMLKSFHVNISYIAYQLFDSGQSFYDYLYLSEKTLRNNNVGISIAQYFRYCRRVYDSLIYGVEDGEEDA